jgi:hypothetical protein
VTNSNRVRLALVFLLLPDVLSPFSWPARATTLPHSAGAQGNARFGRAVFFVSPEGNDAWSGKLNHPNPAYTDGPFRTASRARDAIRKLKRSGQFARPVTVYFRGGS